MLRNTAHNPKVIGSNPISATNIKLTSYFTRDR
ncbi:MAG: hypothetical protein QG567_1867, partial [Campylobacterota bacterium]|nr:hypothetical protein [Campylobacterota bacterium]